MQVYGASEGVMQGQGHRSLGKRGQGLRGLGQLVKGSAPEQQVHGMKQ